MLHADWEDIQAIELAVEHGALWNDQTELAAQLQELAQLNGINFVAAHSKKGAKLPKFAAVPRPDLKGGD